MEKITFRRCKLSIGARNAWLLPRCIDRSHRTMRQTLISVLRQNPRGGESGSGPRHSKGDRMNMMFTPDEPLWLRSLLLSGAQSRSTFRYADHIQSRLTIPSVFSDIVLSLQTTIGLSIWQILAISRAWWQSLLAF